jgi:predicted O-methyltransferase YrrM
MNKLLRKTIKRILIEADDCLLEQHVLTVNNIQEIKKAMKWSFDPVLERPDIYDFDYLEDLNERRIRDAELLATAVKNCSMSNGKTFLEIGTANGIGTILMSVNTSENGIIYTINIPPEEIISGAGGVFTTQILPEKEIGAEYKKKGLTNIRQIFVNTANWVPDIGKIDLAFIDGCHDSDFVYNDTRKILSCMEPGGLILWHDFNPELRKKYVWINAVCIGIERLYKENLIEGRILHLKDSFMGLYKKEK